MRGIEPRSEEKTIRTSTSIVRSWCCSPPIPGANAVLGRYPAKFHLRYAELTSDNPDFFDTLLYPARRGQRGWVA